MMEERFYCVGCGLSKLKPYMYAVLNEIGICRECFEDFHTTKDFTFEGKEFFDIAISPFLYDGIVAEIIRAFKFGNQVRFGDLLTELAFNYLKDSSLFDDYDLIIPVPLHKNRFDERGFNQAEVIAQRLGKLIDREVDSKSLIRLRDTLHQSSLKGIQRIENVKDAFSCKGADFTGKRIILVDDIYTMGETANECAKALVRAGAEKIALFTICKTVIKKKSSLF